MKNYLENIELLSKTKALITYLEAYHSLLGNTLPYYLKEQLDALKKEIAEYK